MLDIEVLKDTRRLLKLYRLKRKNKTDSVHEMTNKCIRELEKEIKQHEEVQVVIKTMAENHAKRENQILEDVLNDKYEKCICGLTGAHYCTGAPGPNGFLNPTYIKGRHKL